MVEFNRQFKEDCLQNERIVKKGPGAEIIKDAEKARNLYIQLNAASEYYLKGARNLLGSDTPYLVFVIGFFAVEFKANALLALRGIKIIDHFCTPLAFSKFLNEKELAKMYSDAYDLRIAYNYRIDYRNLKEGKEDAQEFFDNFVLPFLDRANALIERMLK
jgi:uncharacterized protein (UPF0332 family)